MKKFLKLLVFASLTALILLAMVSCDLLAEDIPPFGNWGPEGQENTAEHKHVVIIDKAVAPTCTSFGLTEGKHCYTCDKVLVAQETILPLDHIAATDAAVEPTCTASGLTAGAHCSVCNEVLVAQEKIPMLGHSMVADAPVDPTCTEIGYTEGVHCSTCGVVFVAQQEIEATGHTVYKIAAIDPTCTTPGVTAGEYCLDCGMILKAPEIIEALGHTEVIDKAIAATCTETGLSEGKHCSVCDAIIVAQEVVDALGHTTVVDAAVAPTCTETGLTEGSHCSACDIVFVAQEVVDALGHTEVVDKQRAPTCTQFGFTKGSHCSVCGETIVAQEPIAPLGHNFVIDEAVAPTCTETGLTEGKHCTRCSMGKVAQQTVPATGHTEVVDAAVAATCSKTGLTEGKHCSVCDAIIVAQQTVPVIDHTEVVDAAVAPTCIETGLTEGKHCSVCDAIIVAQEVVPSLGGHDATIVFAKDPTCTEPGYNTHAVCSRCDYTTRVEIPALGHKEATTPAVAATCTKTGLAEGKHCSVCKEVLVKQEVTPLADHTYSWLNTSAPTCTTDGEKAGTCTACGHTTTVALPSTGHTVVVDTAVAPDCTKTGLTEGKHCSACKEVLVKQEVVPALGHKGYENDFKCDACGEIILPEADFVLTVEQAIALGKAHGHNVYTTNKYYVTGVITEVYNTTWGNMYITDENGNTLTIYGAYSADGELRYDALEVKPVKGGTVTLYGIIGQYNGTPQVKNGWITEYIPGEPLPEEPEVEDPAADSVLTVEQVIALGKSKGHNVYTEGKYYVTGVITEVYNTTWGNMYITDENGNILTIYGAYSADGELRYDALEVKPVVGDTVTIYGIVGQYNGNPQVKNGWIVEHTANETPDTPVVPDEPEVSTGLTLTFDANKANRIEYSTSKQVWAQNGITVTNEKAKSTSNVGDFTNPGRFYKSSDVTIECAGMTKIEINCSGLESKYVDPWLNVSAGTATKNNGIITIVFDTPVDSLVYTSLSAQARANSITVYTQD